MKRRGFLKGMIGLPLVASVPAFATGVVKKEEYHLVKPELFPNLILVNNDISKEEYLDMAKIMGEQTSNVIDNIALSVIKSA